MAKQSGNGVEIRESILVHNALTPNTAVYSQHKVVYVVNKPRMCVPTAAMATGRQFLERYFQGAGCYQLKV